MPSLMGGAFSALESQLVVGLDCVDNGLFICGVWFCFDLIICPCWGGVG